MSVALRELSRSRCQGGVQAFYEIDSEECGAPMRFGVFLPPGASSTSKVPALWVLAGLECNEQTFAIKAGAQKKAAQLGLALITPDTSPRVRIAGDDASWDFGLAASFYVDATQTPWSTHYRMESFITDELRAAVSASFDVDADVRGVMGHSMGGHGALIFGLRHEHAYRSVSAIAPIVAPSQVPWGQKAFTGYFGARSSGSDAGKAAGGHAGNDVWAAHDATALVNGGARFSQHMPNGPLIDQGSADKFLERELRPQLLRDACDRAGVPLVLREQAGCDHGYWFVQSVVDDHLAFHAAILGVG